MDSVWDIYKHHPKLSVSILSRSFKVTRSRKSQTENFVIRSRGTYIVLGQFFLKNAKNDPKKFLNPKIAQNFNQKTMFRNQRVQREKCPFLASKISKLGHFWIYLLKMLTHIHPAVLFWQIFCFFLKIQNFCCKCFSNNVFHRLFFKIRYCKNFKNSR